MSTTIQISAEAYELLRRRAAEVKTTPEQMAETAVPLQLGNTIHIEQRQTRSGPQAYIPGTRVAVRPVVAFPQGRAHGGSDHPGRMNAPDFSRIAIVSSENSSSLA
jgi:hypothetical protein